jgi:glycerophosphoryl diester phosphodiesterase
LVRAVDGGVLAQAEILRLTQLCPQAAQVTPSMVAEARGVAAEVRAWGLSGESAEVIGLIRRVLAAGCDGMTINWPDWVVH